MPAIVDRAPGLWSTWWTIFKGSGHVCADKHTEAKARQSVQASAPAKASSFTLSMLISLTDWKTKRM